MQTSDSIVIIPTYNEKENIENIIRAVFVLEKVFHILVVEDNSPDGTADIVRRMQKEFPERLFMIERKGKLGLGTAYIAGFRWAIETVCRMSRPGSRFVYRIALRKRRQRGELAYGTRADVLLRIEVRTHHHRSEDSRYHCGIRLLPSLGIRNHRA